MQALKVRVENGKIIGNAPAGFAEGAELELCLADPGDQMTDAELRALEDALEEGWQSMQAGRFRPADQLLGELRARR